VAVYCPQCHTANREGSRFCNNCGEPMATPPPEIPIVTAPEPITEGSSEESAAMMEESEVISLAEVPATPPVSRSAAAIAAASAQLADDTPAAPAAAPAAEAQPVTPAQESIAASVAPPDESAENASPAQTDERTQAAAPPSEDATSTAPASFVDTFAANATPPLQDAAGAGEDHTPDSFGSDTQPIAAPRPPRLRVPRLLARVRPPASPRRVLPLLAAPSADRSNLWRRLTYLVLAAAIAVGVVLPPGTLGSSSANAPEVSDLYAYIEALPLRSTVLISFDYEPATSDEMRPLASAVITHLMRRQARILTMSLLPQGPALAGDVMRTLAQENVYAYGADYVNLGFFSGDEAALAALGANLNTVLTGNDASGRPLTAMTLPRAVSNLSEINLAIEIAGDESGAARWVEQVQARTGMPLLALTSAVGLPLAYPYRQSGQLSGLASGLPGAAQYEKLLGYSGQATRGMDAQTLGHLAILLFIVLGNVVWFFSRRKVAP
jgi:hypothetical protein